MYPNLVISYPQMGNYSVVIGQLLRHLFPQASILPPVPITTKTLELGNRYSPDFVCAPFKFNLGNYIESLERGANVLFQTGTGCRYGYYGELQQQILKDLGYDFTFACLSRDKAQPGNALSILRSLGCKLSSADIARALLLAAKSIHFMDRFEYWMRENVGFEAKPGQCSAIHKELLDEIQRADSLHEVLAATSKCKRAVGDIQLEKPQQTIRVGIVGELFTLMEPFSNFNVEQQLADSGIQVSRAMGVWFLLFGKNRRRALQYSRDYLKHHVGANGIDSVHQSLVYSERKYDGIIHMKSFGCIPELNATPALNRLSNENSIPILQLSFDAQTSETGVVTRIEAFTDMLKMKKELSV